MNRYSIIVLSILLLLVSCGPSPEDIAKQTIREYISAIQEGDIERAVLLTSDYEDAIRERLDDGVGSELIDTTKTSFQEVNLKLKCTIDKEDSLTVDLIQAIKSAYTDEKEYYFGVTANGQTEKARTVDVIVSRPQKKTYKIWSTKGLFEYDTDDFAQRTGCKVQLPSLNEYDNDADLEKYAKRFSNNFNRFIQFSEGVEDNDSNKMFEIFPKLKSYKFNFKNKPVPIKISSSKNTDNFIIYCADSTQYRMTAYGEIIDCFGVLSLDDMKSELISLGGIPKDKGRKLDVYYAQDLNNQIVEIKRKIEEEKARIEEEKARIAEEKAFNAYVAKIKSQGVALISSRFTNDGNGAKGVEYTALNTSNKRAKYVIMEVVGYNSVDDPVWSDGYLKRYSGIGPLDPGQYATWNFNNIWDRGDLVKSYEIKALIIQFADGTSKTVKLPEPLPSDWRDWLY